MAATAQRTDPALWDKVKQAVTDGDKGGHAGQWSARKAQLAVAEYKKAGGGYKGRKDKDNHLAEWTREDWGTKSGGESLKTGERYLPKQARDSLTDAEYARTSRKKRADLQRGRQMSAQPTDIARKTARARHAEPTVADLRREASRRGIPGRSRMRKPELLAALA